MYSEAKPDELWLAFDTSGTYQFMKLLLAWIPEFVLLFLIFHSLTGCDTVSAFCGRGKKTAWNTWKVYPKLPRHLKSFSLCELRPVNDYGKTGMVCGVAL